MILYNFLGRESDGLESENCTTDASAECSEPSECKIAKTENNINETKSNELETKELENSNELIEVKVVYNKNKYDVSAPSNSSIADFKKQLQGLLGK